MKDLNGNYVSKESGETIASDFTDMTTCNPKIAKRVACAESYNCSRKYVACERQEEGQCGITVVIDSNAPTQAHFRTRVCDPFFYFCQPFCLCKLTCRATWNAILKFASPIHQGQGHQLDQERGI